MPSYENEETLDGVFNFATIFQSLQNDSFDVHARSNLYELIDSIQRFLRVALEKMSMQKEIDPLLDVQQFIGRELIDTQRKDSEVIRMAARKRAPCS